MAKPTEITAFIDTDVSAWRGTSNRCLDQGVRGLRAALRGQYPRVQRADEGRKPGN
jgi:hypothetical protein